MKKDEEISFFEEIIKNIENNLSELIQFWNIYDQQIFFISAISIYDKLFINQMSDKSSNNDFTNRIMEYGYPVFIRMFYSPEFSQLPGVAHKALDSEHLKLYTKILYSCGILGWMQFFIDNIKAGFFSATKFLNCIRVRFIDKYHWNERLESEYTAWYSDFVSSIQKSEYESINQELPEVLRKLEQHVFVWKDAFMGYSNDWDTEMFFYRHALLDAQQSVEWDYFPDNCKFGQLYYGDIVDAIVEFSGYSIKHIYFAHVLLQRKSALLIENLLQNIIVEEDAVKLISENRNISKRDAESILQLLSLTPEGKTYYDNGSAHSAPLIKVSQFQYVRSIRGFLSEPFGFMLYNLRRQYQSSWDKNANKREEVFREQLYSVFGTENFRCIPHPVVIKKAGKTTTDIDAIIVDKENGEIGLFQLKWQDPADYSPYALRSKRSNYQTKTEEWIKATQQWIDETSEKEMASMIGIPAKFIDKKKIHLFVLGRKHGNYSNGKLPNKKSTWGQWYQFLHLSKVLRSQSKLTLSKMHIVLDQSNPFKRKVVEAVNVFSYGKYRIIFGGNAMGVISELLSRFNIVGHTK